MEILRLKLGIGAVSYYFTSKELTPSRWRVGEYIDYSTLDDNNLCNSILKVCKDNHKSSKLFRIRTLVRSRCKKRNIPTICVIAEMVNIISEPNSIMNINWPE